MGIAIFTLLALPSPSSRLRASGLVSRQPMMRRAITTVLVAAFSLVSSSSALQVTPGSSCSSVCLDSETGNALDPAASTTDVSDIACYDVDYYSTTVGVKFKNCLECLQTSKNASESESDVSWFLCKSIPLPQLPKLGLGNRDSALLTLLERQPAICLCRLSV